MLTIIFNRGSGDVPVERTGSTAVGGRSIYHHMIMRQVIEEDRKYRTFINSGYLKTRKEALAEAIHKSVVKQKEEWIDFITVEDEELLMLN